MESTDAGDGVLRDANVRRQPGQQVGPYVVEATIGAGAMGTVYAALEPGSGTRIAVKLMHPPSYRTGDGSLEVRRTDAWLRNEADALARLSHRNVVRVFGVGSERGRPYMAMEYVHGKTLGAWLADGGHAWDEILRVCLEAARGLSAAHRAGLMHGDFKPDNVMVAADGRVLVMDFGLSRSMTRHARASTETAIPAVDFDEPYSSDQTQTEQTHAIAPDESTDDLASVDPEEDHEDGRTRTGSSRIRRLPGTPAYMAPELLVGVGGDPRSDQFSLCVTMYQALFGRRPYGGRTPTEIAFRVGRGDLRRAPESRRVPAWLHATVTRGLALDPADRWPSVAAMLVALDQRLSQHDRRRNTILVAGLAAGIAGALAMHAWFAATPTPEPTPTTLPNAPAR